MSSAQSRNASVIKIALPAGDLRGSVAGLLASAGLRVEGYGEGSRSYRLSVLDSESLTTRVFRERDIPIQVALGNYDLGICRLAWVKELQARFMRQPIVPLSDLRIAPSKLFMAGAERASEGALLSGPTVRIASEYPNLANAFACAARLPQYRVQAVWGAAEAYPPEDADCVMITARDVDELHKRHGLRALFHMLDNSTWLIGNASALAAKDVSSVLNSLPSLSGGPGNLPEVRLPSPPSKEDGANKAPPARETLRLAVPDGHQQRHVVEALRESGLTFDGYTDGQSVRRPASGIEGLEVKVIRPHDMAALVATGEMDIAVTGRDCLLEHRYAFPSTPVMELLDLSRGQYNLSAVVSEDLPASTIGEALEYWRGQGKPTIRIAAEFPATADHYARSCHFWRYQVIPISGASEGFVPEDADLLIEGTETGKTLVENRLKVIDLLYRSTTCVIANQNADRDGRRSEVFAQVLGMLGRAAGAEKSL